MRRVKEDILHLREEGKTYDEIQFILKCSKGTISYHCGKGQKKKSNDRRIICRLNHHPYLRKIENFSTQIRYGNKYLGLSPSKKLMKSKLETFHREYKMDSKYVKPTFSVDDVINKFGENPVCYLTGKVLNISKPRTYQFDHIQPRSRGGSNSIDNLGLCTKQANRAKGDMTHKEFIDFCQIVIDNKEVMSGG